MVPAVHAREVFDSAVAARRLSKIKQDNAQIGGNIQIDTSHKDEGWIVEHAEEEDVWLVSFPEAYHALFRYPEVPRAVPQMLAYLREANSARLREEQATRG